MRLAQEISIETRASTRERLRDHAEDARNRLISLLIGKAYDEGFNHCAEAVEAQTGMVIEREPVEEQKTRPELLSFPGGKTTEH